MNRFRFILESSRMFCSTWILCVVGFSKFSSYNLKRPRNQMDKFKGGIKAKKKTTVKIRRQEVDEIMNDYSQERFLSEVAKKLVGFNVDIDVLSGLLKNLQIDISSHGPKSNESTTRGAPGVAGRPGNFPSAPDHHGREAHLLAQSASEDFKDLNDDDLFLIYNLLTEPLLKNEERTDHGIVSVKTIYGREDDIKMEYCEKLSQVSLKFVDVLPNQRVNGIYHNLPSLELNRMNFEIEKDIFRNKPLLGKGIFKCEKCGSDDTEDYEKQTRSADEPMTVFVHCRKCNARFRYG